MTVVVNIGGDHELARRFWSKVRVVGPDECWEWDKAVDRQGYGRFRVGGRAGQMQEAHRVAYQIAVGPIPPGFEVDHVRARGCRCRSCVNPMHLQAVTPKVNSQRSTAGAANRARQLALTHCKRDHEFTPANTAIKPTTGARRCRTCDRDAARARRRAVA